MEKIKRRGALRNRRSKAGETLTETLVAMLIVGLSSVLFLTMVGAAGRIFRMAREEYKEVYEVIAQADVQSAENDTVTDKITITVDGAVAGAAVDVLWYGNEDYVLSYKVK